jgi:hypothetical protein
LLKYKGSGGKNSLPTATTTTGHMSILKAKTCTKCTQEKTLENFYTRSSGVLRNDCIDCILKRNKEYYLNNKNQITETNKRWTQKNKNKIRDTKLRNKFGITLEEKNQLFDAQGKCCAICKATKNNKKRDWDVDHCHKTGVVRGLLCSNCNRALGLFQDDPMVLWNAHQYLNQKNKW